MNCEKCKNKKATVFFADEGGGRHALCASCSAIQSKIASRNELPRDNEEEKEAFMPRLTLASMTDTYYPALIIGDVASSCKGCGMTAELAKSLGRMCCPECYSAFYEALFPAPASDAAAVGIKMPYAIQQRANKEKILAELRIQLRSAVDSENFELAATVRDKIRSIENKVR